MNVGYSLVVHASMVFGSGRYTIIKLISESWIIMYYDFDTTVIMHPPVYFKLRRNLQALIVFQVRWLNLDPVEIKIKF